MAAKTPVWHGVVTRWLERAAARGQSIARSIEISVGRRSAEVLATLDVDVDGGERVDALSEQIIATLEDLAAMNDRRTTYTLRTRVRVADNDRHPGVVLEVPIDPPSASAESAAAPSAADKLLAAALQYNERLTAQLVSLTSSQHAGYAAVVSALTGANKSLSTDLNEERGSRREYQTIAAEAVAKVEELNAELAKVDRDESKIKQLANALLDAFVEKKLDGETVKKTVVSLVKGERDSKSAKKISSSSTSTSESDPKTGEGNG